MKRFIVLFVLLAIFQSCKNNTAEITTIKKIGKQLVELKTNTNQQSINAIVHIGDGLLRELSLLRVKKNTFSFKVLQGDFKRPYGNNTADYILIIDTNYKDIGIRLKYNEILNKYDILGWATL